MKKILLIALLSASPLPALAQAVESAPLQPMTIQPTLGADASASSAPGATAAPASDIGTSDMDRDAPPPSTDAALPPSPPPGPDSLPAQSDTSPVEVNSPDVPDTGSNVSPAGDARPPAPVSTTPRPGEGFPQGKTPPDRDMSSRVFCTLKVSFAKSADAKIYDAVKSYVDENADTIRRQPIKPKPGKGDEMCLMVEQHNKRARIYKDLKRLLPMKTRKESGIILSGEGFVPVTTRD